MFRLWPVDWLGPPMFIMTTPKCSASVARIASHKALKWMRLSAMSKAPSMSMLSCTRILARVGWPRFYGTRVCGLFQGSVVVIRMA